MAKKVEKVKAPLSTSKLTAQQITDGRTKLSSTASTSPTASITSTPGTSASYNSKALLGLNKYDMPTAYAPTAGATSPTYLKFAFDPETAKLGENGWMFTAATADGTSYVPRSNTSAYDIALNEFNKGLSGSGAGGSGGIYGRANFQASQAYNDAMAYTNQLLAQLSSGRTQYTDQINALMDTINNRAAFNYDPDNDPLFQQYLASSMESGKTAMQDTMAQASALTGGYGSSYATAAANGAYNNFVEGAYDALPEYYQTALEAYNGETNNLYNKLNMYSVADATAYDRLANAYQMNYGAAQDMYGREYQNYWDTLNYNTGVDEYNADLAYRYASLAQDQAQYTANMQYKQLQDRKAEYDAYNEKLASKDNPSLDVTDTYSNIDRVIANSGYGSDEYYATIADYANQGYDMDSMLTYGSGGVKNKNYIVGSDSETFALVSGKAKKDDAVYQDAYGNTYTYKELINSGVDKSRIKS